MTEVISPESNLPTPDKQEGLIEDNRLFLEALEYQMKLDETGPYGSYQEACAAASQCANDLNRKVIKSKIINQMVTMNGENLVAPRLMLDVNLGAVDIMTGRVQADGNNPTQEQSIHGAFAGFAPNGSPIGSNSKTFRALLGYSIAVTSKIHTTNFVGNCLAYGDLSSELVFLEDRKAKDTDRAVGILSDVTDRTTVATLQNIDDLLNSKDRFNQITLREMARLVREDLGDDNQHIDWFQKDAVLELVKAKLGLYSGRHFLVDASSSIQTTTYDSDYTVRTFVEPEIMAIKDVMFAPYYIEDGKDIESDKAAVAIMVERADENSNPQLVCVLLENIKTLKSVGDVIIDF